MKNTRRTGRLPVSPAKGTHQPEGDNAISQPEPSLNKSVEQKLKVFIADDSTAVRKRLKEMLKENESLNLVGESADAEQASISLRHLKPDVVILDIHMPLGGGRRVLRELKSMNSGSVVIIFTAFPYPQYRNAYLAAGADYFFDKMNDVQQMADVLAELASQHIPNGDREDRDR